MSISPLKSALLATAALGVAATTSHAVAAPAPAPTEIVQTATPSVTHAADDLAPMTARNAGAAKKAGLLAAGAAVLAALGSLIGWRRIRRAVAAAGPLAVGAVRAVGEAPAAVAQAIGKAASKPFRFLAGLAALVAFALFGLDLFDLEWAGGLLAGALGVASVWAVALRTQKLARIFARKRVK